MPQPTLFAFVAAALLALVGVAYLWRVQRAKFVVSEGIRALAAMRWREFSQFVITALQAQGFDAHPLSSSGNANEPADLVLTRDSRSWLLSCRQAADYRVTERHVEDMRRAVAARSAAGGIIATLGRVEPGARRVAQDIELIDGGTLWTLIGPLLPAGLHEHLAERALARTRVATAGVLGAAVLLGAVLSLVSVGTDEAPAAADAPLAATPEPSPASPAPATSAPEPATIGTGPAPGSADVVPPPVAPGPVPPGPAVPPPATPAATVEGGLAGDASSSAPGLPPDEERQRQQIVDSLARVPGIENVTWSSRSTLVLQSAPGAADPREQICAVMRRFEALRASRIQLQPPGGSTGQVRFFHCAAY